MFEQAVGNGGVSLVIFHLSYNVQVLTGSAAAYGWPSASLGAVLQNLEDNETTVDLP